MKRRLLPFVAITALVVLTVVIILATRKPVQVSTDSGKPLLVLQHDTAAKAANWSKDETRILSYDGKAIYIWDATTGKQQINLVMDAEVTSATWTQDETRILAYSSDNTVKLWDAASGKLLTTLKHSNTVNGVLLNKDASRILTYARDNAAHIWDVASGKELFTLQHDAESNVWDANWNNDESRILTYASDGTVRIWDAKSGKLLQKLTQSGRIGGVLWSNDESQVFVIDNDNQDHWVRVWEVADGKALFTLKHDGWINGMLWNKDKTRLLTYSDDGSARLWDAATGKELVSLQPAGPVQQATWNKDETRILTYAKDGTVRVWESDTGKVLFTLQHGARVNGAMWNKDETRLLTYSNDGSARIWDAATGNALYTLWHRGNVSAATWNSSESRVLTLANSGDGCTNGCEYAVWTWDASNGQPLFTIVAKAPISSVSWNKDYTRLLVAPVDNAVQIWDANQAGLQAFPTATPFAGVKPGHWSDGGGIAFDVTSDMKITNFSASVPVFSKTCLFDLKNNRLDINAGGTVSISVFLGQFKGQFGSDTSIEGTYQIGVCGNTGFNTDAEGWPAWSAKWSGTISQQLATPSALPATSIPTLQAAIPTIAVPPTATANLETLVAATFDARATATANVVASFTKTPTLTPTPTPNIQQTLAAIVGATDTAVAIQTSTMAPLSTLVATLVPTSGVTANSQWTPLLHTFDGVEMMLVPPGCFMMGSNDFEGDETPVNKQCFDKPFWIDKYEVTRGQFKQSGGVKAQSSIQSGPNQPVDHIVWFEARDYCAERGARLPTEAEWEYAARGPDDLVYPWGNTWDDKKVAVVLADVGSIPAGVSWVGALDMSGSNWEWVSSIYQPYPYTKDDGREDILSTNTSDRRVIRGGSWDTGGGFYESSIIRRTDVNAKDLDTGFRCARSYDGVAWAPTSVPVTPQAIAGASLTPNIETLAAATFGARATATANVVASFTKTATPTETPNYDKTTVAIVAATDIQATLNSVASYTITPTITIDAPSPTFTPTLTYTPNATFTPTPLPAGTTRAVVTGTGNLPPSTPTPVPVSQVFVITDPAFSATYKSDCDTDVTINAVQGTSFDVSGTLSNRNGKWVLWCYGAKHTWIGKLTYAGYTFASDRTDPLQFRVDASRGYVYLGGKGTIRFPNGKVTTLPLGANTSTPAQITTLIPAGVKMTPTVYVRQAIKGVSLVWVPAGCFMMGSTDQQVYDASNQAKKIYGDSNVSPSWFTHEQPRHKVCITHGFWIGEFDITNAQFNTYVKAVGAVHQVDNACQRGSSDPDQPVVCVSWNDAVAYAKWLGGRLPTEAEWEYAARSPKSLIYPWGNTFDQSKANTFEGGVGRTTDVGSYPAGASWVGAQDMAGNVWQWVADWYSDGYYQNSPQNDPTGPSRGQFRVLRGGSWYHPDFNARAANSAYNNPDSRTERDGFRVVVSDNP